MSWFWDVIVQDHRQQHPAMAGKMPHTEEIEAAAKLAPLSHFIMALPDKL